MEIEVALELRPDGGLRAGVVIATFLYGLRHGIDLDHLAAISDITGSQSRPSRAMFLATVYAVGHALVILVLGSVAIVAGARLPSGADEVMEHVVGLSLLILGGYVFYSLLRYGRDFRLRSRWVLLFEGVRRTFRWLSGQRYPERIEIEHSHPADGPHHDHAALAVHDDPASAGRLATATQIRHRHAIGLPDDPFVEYGAMSAAGVGVIHGIGAETPTQVLLLVTAAGVGGGPVGLLLLGVFILGLLVSNTAVAAATAVGFAKGRRAPAIYLTLALVTGITSVAMGLVYVAGKGDVLPSVFG